MKSPHARIITAFASTALAVCAYGQGQNMFQSDGAGNQYLLNPAPPAFPFAPRSLHVGTLPVGGFATLRVRGDQLPVNDEPGIGGLGLCTFRTDVPAVTTQVWRMMRDNNDIGLLWNENDDVAFHVQCGMPRDDGQDRYAGLFLQNHVGDGLWIMHDGPPTNGRAFPNALQTVNAKAFAALGTDQSYIDDAGIRPEGAWSRFHLFHNIMGLNYPWFGHRPQMRNGLTLTGNSDHAYIGQWFDQGENAAAAEVDDHSNLVIANSENGITSESSALWDNISFRFFSDLDQDDGPASSLEGLETMRIRPYRQPGDFPITGHVGIGDFLSANAAPEERLDILDQTIRIRSFVDALAYRRDTYDRVLVANPADGRIYWRPASTIGGGGGGADCKWTQTGPNLDRICTAYTNNPGCSQDAGRVGIGTSLPTGKLTVLGNVAGNIIEASPGANSAAANGVVATIAAPTGGTPQATYRAIVGDAFNASSSNQGGSFTGRVQAGFSSTANHGLRAEAVVEGTVPTNHGGYFRASASSNTYDNFGTWAQALGPATGKNMAVFGDARNSTVQNLGVHGNAVSSNGVNTGVLGIGDSNQPATLCFGVRGWTIGTASYNGNITKWAAHFTGNTFATNGVWTSSDAMLKQNILDLSPDVAREKLMALRPKTYQFNVEQFPTLNLPSASQMGFDPAEVQEVLPDLVTGVIHPPVQNENGEVIAEEIQHRVMNYQGLIPVLVGAVQSQQGQFQSVEERLAQTENALAETQATLAEAVEALSTANTIIEQLQAAQAQQTRAMDDCCTQHQQLQDRMTSPQGDDANGLWVVPNPVARETQLRYRLAEAGRVRLVVTGSGGRNVQELRSEEAMDGEHLYYWNTSGIAPGQYSVVLYLNDALLVKRVVKVQE